MVGDNWGGEEGVRGHGAGLRIRGAVWGMGREGDRRAELEQAGARPEE